MQFAAHVLDNLVAHKLSSLKTCNPPDVPKLPDHHMSLIGGPLSGAKRTRNAHSEPFRF
jgi:hypothetical protein